VFKSNAPFLNIHYRLLAVTCTGKQYLSIKINSDNSEQLKFNKNYILPKTNSASEMTYIVSSGALNSTHSLTHLRLNFMLKQFFSNSLLK